MSEMPPVVLPPEFGEHVLDGEQWPDHRFQRAVDVLRIIGRPDRPCAYESAGRLFAFTADELQWVYENHPELFGCTQGCPPGCDDGGGGTSGRLIALEWAHKGKFKGDQWREARPGSEGLSSVVHRPPYPGRIVRVVATSSDGQTPPGKTWEWRLLRNGAVVAGHPVTGVSGATSWDVDVDDDDHLTVDVNGIDSEGSVDDALIEVWMEV